MKSSTKNIISPGTLKILVQFFFDIKCAIDVIFFQKSSWWSLSTKNWKMTTLFSIPIDYTGQQCLTLLYERRTEVEHTVSRELEYWRTHEVAFRKEMNKKWLYSKQKE